MTGAITSIARLGVSLIPDLAAFAGVGQQAADAGKKFGDAWNKAFLDSQKDGSAKWLQAFTKDMQDARMVAARGGQLASETFLGGLQGIKAGNPQQIFNTMTNAVQGVTAAFGGAGQAVAGLIPQIGPALGAAIGIGTDAMQLFIDTGGGYLTMLTEIGDKYLTASRTLAGSLIDHKDIDSTLSSIREIMASGAVDHFADVENSIGRFSRALNLSGEDLTDFTQMYAAAVELLGNFDPTNTAGIMRAFEVNPDEMAAKLQQLTNIVRDTGGEMGRIQDQMIRSGPAFRELGYGITETAYFFGKQIEEGERGTKLVYGINQMVDKLNQGVQAGTFKDLKTGWQDMIRIVKELDAAGQKSTALDILGQYTTPTNATLWLEEIRRNILLTPEAMSKAVQSYDQDIAKTAAKTTDLAGVFENISQTFEAALMPIGITLASGLVGAGNQVVAWMSENQALIANWGAEVANWFLGGAGAIAGALGGIMTSLSGIIDQAKFLIVESIQVVMNAVRLPLNALAEITPDFLGGDAIRGISDAFNQVDKGLQGIQDSNWSDGFAKAGGFLTDAKKQVPELQETLRKASTDFASSLDITSALKSELDTTRDGLEDIFKGLTKGATANAPMLQLVSDDPQVWATAKARMQALGLTMTITADGVVTAVTAANEKAQESWAAWYESESKKKLKVEVEATKDGNPISDSNPLIPPTTTTVEVRPQTQPGAAASATPGVAAAPTPTGGKVYTTPSGAPAVPPSAPAAAPAAPTEMRNPTPYLPGTEPGATPSSATPAAAAASATPPAPAALPPVPATPAPAAAPLAAESGYVANKPAGSPGVYPSVATVPFNEYSAPSPNSHPRTETYNKDYTQLLNETATPEKPSLIVLHSSEGNQGAADQAASMESSGKSYHFIVDKDGKTVLDVIDTSQAAKSVYDPGNNKSINIGMAGTFADQWGKSDWLARSDQLKTTAAIAVREAVKAGIPASIIQSQSGGSGIVGHDWVAENIGVPPGGEAHSDPGDNFPWAEFSQFVQDAAATVTGVASSRSTIPVAPAPPTPPVPPVAPTAPTAAPVAPDMVPGLAPYIPTLAPGASAAASPAFTPSRPPSATNPLPVAVVSPKPSAVAPFVTPGVPYTVPSAGPSAGFQTPGVPYIPQLSGAPGAAPAPQAPAAPATPPSSTGTWSPTATGWLWWQNSSGETFWVAPNTPRPTLPTDSGVMAATTNGYWSSMPNAEGKPVMVFRANATAPTAQTSSGALVPPASPSAPLVQPKDGVVGTLLDALRGNQPDVKPIEMPVEVTKDGKPIDSIEEALATPKPIRIPIEMPTSERPERPRPITSGYNPGDVPMLTTPGSPLAKTPRQQSNEDESGRPWGPSTQQGIDAYRGAAANATAPVNAQLQDGTGYLPESLKPPVLGQQAYGTKVTPPEGGLSGLWNGFTGIASDIGDSIGNLWNRFKDQSDAPNQKPWIEPEVRPEKPMPSIILDPTLLEVYGITPPVKRSVGGAVFGAGTATSDSIPAWLSNGEFVQKTAAVEHYGLDFMHAINEKRLPKFNTGGEVSEKGPRAKGRDLDSAVSYLKGVDGTPYVLGGLDCTQLVEEAVTRYRGMPSPGALWTGNQGDWLAQMGFQPGLSGAFKVGWGGQDVNTSEGGHTAMTLPNGVNAESAGGSVKQVRYGRGARGATDPMFGSHASFASGGLATRGSNSFADGGEVEGGLGEDFNSGTLGLDIFAWLAKRFNRANDALNEEMFGRRTVVPWSDWGFSEGGEVGHTRIGDDFKTGTRGLDIVAWLAKRFNRANDALNEEMFGRRTVVPWSDWGFAGGGLATHKPDLGGGGSGDEFGYTDWGDNWEEYWRWVNKTGTPVGRAVDSRGLPTAPATGIKGGFPGLWDTAKSLLGFEEGGAPGSGGSPSGSLDEWLKAQGLDANKPALTWDQLQAAAATGPKAPTIGLPSGRTITPNTSKSNSLGLGSTPNVNAAPGAKAQQNLTDLAAGFQGSAQSAVESTVEAIQDPAAAAKALAPLINAGGEGAPGAGEAWVNVAKGMTHWDEWEDNPYGAAGGVSFDIGSLIYGGGAAATSKVAREATIPGAIGAAARNSRAGQAIAKPVGAATSAVNIGLANAQARIGAMGANLAPAMDLLNTFGGIGGGAAAMAITRGGIEWHLNAEMGDQFSKSKAVRKAEIDKRYGHALGAILDPAVIAEVGTPWSGKGEYTNRVGRENASDALAVDPKIINALLTRAQMERSTEAPTPGDLGIARMTLTPFGAQVTAGATGIQQAAREGREHVPILVDEKFFLGPESWAGAMAPTARDMAGRAFLGPNATFDITDPRADHDAWMVGTWPDNSEWEGVGRVGPDPDRFQEVSGKIAAVIRALQSSPAGQRIELARRGIDLPPTLSGSSPIDIARLVGLPLGGMFDDPAILHWALREARRDALGAKAGLMLDSDSRSMPTVRWLGTPQAIEVPNPGDLIAVANDASSYNYMGRVSTGRAGVNLYDYDTLRAFGYSLGDLDLPALPRDPLNPRATQEELEERFLTGWDNPTAAYVNWYTGLSGNLDRTDEISMIEAKRQKASMALLHAVYNGLNPRLRPAPDQTSEGMKWSASRGINWNAKPLIGRPVYKTDRFGNQIPGPDPVKPGGLTFSDYGEDYALLLESIVYAARTLLHSDRKIGPSYAEGGLVGFKDGGEADDGWWKNVSNFGKGIAGGAKDAVTGLAPLVGLGGEDGPGVAEAWTGLATGLAPLVGLGGEGAAGVGESWTEFGKAAINYDMWTNGQGQKAEAAGRNTFDVLTMFIPGAGAVAKGAKATSLGSKVAGKSQAILDSKPVQSVIQSANMAVAKGQARVGAMGASMAPALDLFQTFGGVGGGAGAAMGAIDWGKTAELGRLFSRPLAERKAESMKRYGDAYDAITDQDVIDEIGTPYNKKDATNRLGKETSADVLALDPALIRSFLTGNQAGRATDAPTLNDEQIARLTVSPWGAQVTAGAKRIQEAELEGRTRIPVVVDQQFFLRPESWPKGMAPTARDMAERSYRGINESLGLDPYDTSMRYGISAAYKDAMLRVWPENERMTPNPDNLMDSTSKIATIIAALRGEGDGVPLHRRLGLAERGIHVPSELPMVPESMYQGKAISAQIARLVGLPVSDAYSRDPAALHWALRDARRDNAGAKAILGMELTGMGGVLGLHHVRMLGTPQARETPAFGDTIGVAARSYGDESLRTYNYETLKAMGFDINELDQLTDEFGDPMPPDEIDRLGFITSRAAAYLEWYTGRSGGIDRTDEISMLSGNDGGKVTMSMLAAVYNGANPNLRPAPDQTHDGTNWSNSSIVGFNVRPLIGAPEYFDPTGANASESRRNQVLRPGGLPFESTSLLNALMLESIPYGARSMYLSDSKTWPGHAEGGLVGYAPGGAVIPQEELLEGGGGDFNSTDAEPGTWDNFRQVWSDTGKFASATVGKFFNAADELVTGAAPLVGAGNLLNDAVRLESQLLGRPDQSIKDYKAPGVADSWKAYASGLAPLVGAGNVVNDALGISYEPRRRVGDEGIPSGTRDAWKNAAKGAIRYDEYKQDGAPTVGATAFDALTALLPGGAAFRSARLGTLGAKPGSASPSTYGGDRMGDALKALDVKPMSGEIVRSSTTTTPRTQPVPGAGVFGQGSSYSGGLADAVARAKEQFGDVIFEGLGPRLDPDELSWLSFRARNGYDEKLGIPGGALATNLTGMLGGMPDELLNDAYNAAYNMKVLAPEVGITDVQVGKSKDGAIAHFDPRTFSIVLADQLWKDSDLIRKAAEQSGGRGFWGMDSGTGPPADGPVVHEWMHGLQEMLTRKGGLQFAGGMQDRALFAKFQEFAPEWANMNRNTASDAAYEQAMKEFAEWKREKFPDYALKDDYEMFAESMADVMRSGEGAYAGPKWYYDFTTGDMRSLGLGGRLPRITSDIENDLHRDFGAEEDYTNELLAAAAARELQANSPQGMLEAEARTYGDAVRQPDGRFRIKPAEINWAANVMMANTPVSTRKANAEQRYGHAWEAVQAGLADSGGSDWGALSMDPAILQSFRTRAQQRQLIPSDDDMARLTVSPWGAQLTAGGARVEEAIEAGRARMPVIVDEKFFLEPDSWEGRGPLAQEMEDRYFLGLKGDIAKEGFNKLAEQAWGQGGSGSGARRRPGEMLGNFEDVSGRIAQVIDAVRRGVTSPEYMDRLRERGISLPPRAPMLKSVYDDMSDADLEVALARLAGIVGLPVDQRYSNDPAALHWALRDARRDNLGGKAAQLLAPDMFKQLPTVRWLGTPQAAEAPAFGDLIGVAFKGITNYSGNDKASARLYNPELLRRQGFRDFTSRDLPLGWDDGYGPRDMSANDLKELSEDEGRVALLDWYTGGVRENEISMVRNKKHSLKSSLALWEAVLNGINPNLRPAYDQTPDGMNMSANRMIDFNAKPLIGDALMSRSPRTGEPLRQIKEAGLPFNPYSADYDNLLQSLPFWANELLSHNSRTWQGYAAGGAIFGAGSATSDSIPAWLSNGEFVQNAAAVDHYGLDFMHRLNTRQLPKPVMLAEGGDVAAAASMNGVGYSKTSNPRTDCSGSVSLVINGALGLPQGPSMTTREDAEPFLTERGFVPGEGGEGDMTVYWYNNGPNPDDGHMVMRLSNGVMFESGGSSGPNVVYGASPDMGPMTYAMHRAPLGYGQGEATGGGAGAPSTSSYSVPSQSGGGGGGGGGSLSFGPQAYGGGAPGNPYSNMPGGMDEDQRRSYTRAYIAYQQNYDSIQTEISNSVTAQAKAQADRDAQLEKSAKMTAELEAKKAEQARAEAASSGAAGINTAKAAEIEKLKNELDGVNGVARTMQQTLIDANRRVQTAKEREILFNFEGPPKPPKGKGQQVDENAKDLGSGLVKGVFEALGFGDIFGSDPTQWGIWKLLTSGLSYGMNLLGPGGGGLNIPGGALGGNTTQSAVYGAGNAVIPGVTDLIPGLKPGGLPPVQPNASVNAVIPGVTDLIPGLAPVGVQPNASVTPAMATSQAPVAADGLSTGAPSINVTTNVNNNGMTTKQEFQNTWNDAHLARDRGLAAATPANGGAGLVSVGPN